MTFSLAEMVSVHAGRPSDPSGAGSATTAAGEPPAQKSFSCVLCAQRKVKCDRLPGGCANCTKLLVQCVYKAPPPPRRKKKGMRETDVTTRLRIYEDALRQFGVDPERLVRQECGKLTRGQKQVTGFGGSFDSDISSKAQTAHVASEAGVLIMEEGKSRYLENGIWTSLRGEFRETREILDESSDVESLSSGSCDSPDVTGTDGTALIMGTSSGSTNLQSLHPCPIQVLKLWQIYLDNINPLVKVCHVPTVQRLVFNASDSLYALPQDLEALFFAIYCITVQSLSDEECIAMLGQPRATAIRRFRRGAQQALINANFLKSASFMLLQAFTLFIVSLEIEMESSRYRT